MLFASAKPCCIVILWVILSLQSLTWKPTAGVLRVTTLPIVTPVAQSQTLLKQLSVSDDVRIEFECKGGLDKDDLRQFVKKSEIPMRDEEIDEVFDICDINGDGKLELAEFEQAILESTPTPDPRAYILNMIQNAEVVQMLAEALLESAQEVDANNPIDAVSSEMFDAERFVKVIDSVKHKQALALQQHCAMIRAASEKKKKTENSSNRFANADGKFTYVGNFGTMQHFLEGIDAIGLPQPNIFAGTQACLYVCVSFTLFKLILIHVTINDGIFTLHQS